MASEKGEAPSKLSEQATSKADLSYSYWAAGQKQQTGTFKEKKLTDEKAREQERLAREVSERGASVWNQAGTFEERNVTAWAKEQLEVLLVGLENSTPAARVTVSGLTSATGEAHVWIMRHKKRAGFDFDIELAWSAAFGTDAAAAAGTLKLPGISPDDIDDLAGMLEVTVRERGEGCGSEADVVRAVKGVSAQLQARLKELQKLLKEK